MHFEILVEDQSGKKALDILVPKIVGVGHTFNVHPYKGIGRIPKNLRSGADASKRIPLDSLPRLIRGYGKTFSGYPNNYTAAVVVVCDLDDNCLKAFREKLFEVLNSAVPRPKAQFCIAIEEGEAWFLGDIAAIKAAYPSAKDSVLKGYVNDSICGTWETLAEAISPGGLQALQKKGRQAIGAEKSNWAKALSPHMDVGKNKSPSFCYFRKTMRELAGVADT